MPTRLPLPFLALLLFITLLPGHAAGALAAAGHCSDALADRIPPRAADAEPAAGFVRQAQSLTAPQRESLIERQLAAGNLPSFLRHLVPVSLHGVTAGGRPADVTICVLPDYLSVGSDSDYMLVPMSLPVAARLAQRFGFVLPTRKIVDAIYHQASVHLVPQPLPAGDAMRSTDYYLRHDQMIRAQRRAIALSPGLLTAGHKKDLVLTNRLAAQPQRVAIYGWHQPGGRPIQSLSTVHGYRYVDYSHGVRLVSDIAWVNGQRRPLRELLQEPLPAAALSDEGPVAADPPEPPQTSAAQATPQG